MKRRSSMEMKTCPKCGAEYENGVCPDCGLVEESDEWVDAVNVLFDKANEEAALAEPG
jgi:RNA polymerase subunit RPABC4/transcription elongation factor Spt4